MKLRLLTIFLMLIILSTGAAYAQMFDSINVASMLGDTIAKPVPDVNSNFEPAALAGLIIAAIVVIAGVMLGALLAIAIAFILFALVSVGILSASVIAGIYKQSVSTAFRVFVVSFSTFITAISFGLAAYMLNAISQWFSSGIAVGIGIALGALGGFLLGTAIFYTLQRVLAWLKSKVQ